MRGDAAKPPQGKIMRALWIEDHQLIGDSLEMLLQVLMPDVSLDKARDLDLAAGLVKTIAYEVVLMDWWLGQSDGATTIKALREAGCEAPILVVSGDERELVMREALAAGAIGYVTKSAEPEQLVKAVRDALQGVVHRLPRRPPGESEAHAPLPALDVRQVFPDLTPRQSEVFRLLMRGESDKRIARDLGLSDTTVKSHVRAILQIVGARSRGEAAYAARSRGAGEA
jgi:two-component system nitrate/nitrite response regulator NarL